MIWDQTFKIQFKKISEEMMINEFQGSTPKGFTKMKIEEIGKILQETQHLCIDERDGFSNKFGWQKGDARWEVFNKCSSVLISIGLGLVFVERHLAQRKWWEENSTLHFTDQTILDTSKEFEMFLREEHGGTWREHGEHGGSHLQISIKIIND